MAKTYCTCIGMRGERTARGGNDGCRASVQSWDGSVIVHNWYDSNNNLRVRVGTSKNSSCCSDWSSPDFTGTIDELNALLQLNADIKAGRISVVRHRIKK